jgi:hypothetical protein
LVDVFEGTLSTAKVIWLSKYYNGDKIKDDKGGHID